MFGVEIDRFLPKTCVYIFLNEFKFELHFSKNLEFRIRIGLI